MVTDFVNGRSITGKGLFTRRANESTKATNPPRKLSLSSRPFKLSSLKLWPSSNRFLTSKTPRTNSPGRSFTRKLREAERVLDVLVDDYSDYSRPKRSKPDEEATEFEDDSSLTSAGPTTLSLQLNLTDILSYAHRIRYTTFAPLEFGAGNASLRGALPPAPQEEQMRSSQLYNLASLDVGLPKTVESDPMIEPLPAQPPAELNPLAKLNITVSSGWKPGMPVELPIEIPVPPPGWKPGDPVPLPAMASIPLPRIGEQQLRYKPAEPIQVRPVQLDILDQDDDSSDYSSDEGSSDDDDS